MTGEHGIEVGQVWQFNADPASTVTVHHLIYRDGSPDLYDVRVKVRTAGRRNKSGQIGHTRNIWPSALRRLYTLTEETA